MKIADFGLATIINKHLKKTPCGSPGYIAPEIFKKIGYDNKVDMFSLGVILFIMYLF